MLVNWERVLRWSDASRSLVQRGLAECTAEIHMAPERFWYSVHGVDMRLVGSRACSHRLFDVLREKEPLLVGGPPRERPIQEGRRPLSLGTMQCRGRTRLNTAKQAKTSAVCTKGSVAESAGSRGKGR
jgi:hypothetical protein